LNYTRTLPCNADYYSKLSRKSQAFFQNFSKLFWGSL